MHLRTVSRRDLEGLKMSWSRPDWVSLVLNLLLVTLIWSWFSEPLDPQLVQKMVVAGCVILMYSQSPHQEARVAALKQIKNALVQFVEIENKMYHRARKYRNQLADQVNDLQQEIDNQRGLFYRWTTFLRKERIIRDTSTLEGLALRTSSVLGNLITDNLADQVIRTRGFGPIIFVCLPRDAQTPAEFFQANDYVVFGVYFFGKLITRFHAATTLLTLFPQTLESDRLVAMRQDALRLRSLINEKEHELHFFIKLKYGLILDD